MNQSGISQNPIKLFISYSQDDDDLRSELENTHLEIFKRQGKIQSWSKGAIVPGVEWEEAITQALEAAQIILLLISPNFIASDKCYGQELQRALQRHKEGMVSVIPVILRPTYLEDTPFSSLQQLPSSGKPITSWSNRDAAFLNVVKGIGQVVQSLQSRIDRETTPGQAIALAALSSDSFSTPVQNEETCLQQVGCLTFWCMFEIYIDDLIEQLDSLLESLFEALKKQCSQKILSQHSRIKLLSGDEIEVDQLYVDVWLLEKPEHKQFNSPDSLLKSFDAEENRLALSNRIQRNPGFEVANANSKLLILGKPGSGKTTFLKHLAVDWCNGKFQPGLVTVLLDLRRIRDDQWNLLSAIGEELKLEEEQEICMLSEWTSLLLLMDGLDEVSTNSLRHNVQDQIHKFSQKYPKNRYILTCRTQVMEVNLDGFTSVEVADFSQKQVEQFVQNWFKASGNSEVRAKAQWENFRSAVANKPDLKELTVSPVLLNLICLVLQDEGEITSDRAWLYKKGISLLLSRWNAEKQIDIWEVGTKTYRELDIEAKEALLIELAARKFENPKNFVLFEQDKLADQITQRLKLTNRIEGVGVLKAIEAQHGLLVERADELWSFSHLTLQEYFTVHWLIQRSSTELADKVANPQWQQVMKQLVKSQQPADLLLRRIKEAIEQSISHETVIQTFFEWLFQKSKSTHTNYKPAAIRALYYALALALNRNRDRDLDLYCKLARKLDHNLDLDLDRNLDLDLDLDRALYHALYRALDRVPNLYRDRVFFRSLYRDQYRESNVERAVDRDFSRAIRDHARALDHAVDRARTCIRDHFQTDSPILISKLSQLKGALPPRYEFQQWWQAHGPKWVEQFRQMMIEHRNMGYDWQFTDKQQQQLERYYDDNKFLVDLMHIEGAVNDDISAEIEDTLLLPWSELHRRHPEIYPTLE